MEPQPQTTPKKLARHLSKAARNVLRGAGVIGWAIGLAELADWLSSSKSVLDPEGAGWLKIGFCYDWDGSFWSHNAGSSPSTPTCDLYKLTATNSIHDRPPAGVAIIRPPIDVDDYVGFSLYNRLAPDFMQSGISWTPYTYASSWHWVRGVSNWSPYLDVSLHNLNPAVNPNVQRALPSVKPVGQVIAEAAADAQAASDAAGKPPTSSGSSTDGVARSLSPSGVREIPPIWRRPPDKNERQTKRKTQSQRIMAAIFKALDGVSEFSEVIDSFYQALPASVRKKSGCDKINRGFIDNAGQYGIDGADCKAVVLFNNADAIDMDEAFRNILANWLEDKIIGAKERMLRVKKVSALREADKAFGKKVSEAADALAHGNLEALADAVTNW
jgi:hypothetical protein